MIWLIFASMTLAALGVLVWPLLRARPAAAPSGTAHLAIYTAQIAEIDADVAAGLVSADDAAAARTEAARRLLSERTDARPASGSAARRTAAAGFVAACCVAGFLIYAEIGSPSLPDLPLSARNAAPEQMDFASALARIEAHLAKDPDDVRGWKVVAPVYLRMGRNDDAVAAYAAILRLGESADARADYAEALVYRAQGTVTADARREFEASVASEPGNVKARYYLGLAAEQDGDGGKAKTIWSALAAEAPAGSPLATALNERIAALDGTTVNSDATKGDPPNTDMGKDIVALPQDAQQAAIRGMVERLAGRLHDGGGTVGEWLRLVRAYRVLNEAEKARTALADARRTFANDTAAKESLDALARELGLES